jgi:ubiquinone/menaquinone biosynthesis C-methylase UbiE
MSKPKNLNEYYNQTSDSYESNHVCSNDEHFNALEYSFPLIESLNINSILDVGCGTGRALKWVQQRISDITLIGIDPSPDLLLKAKESLPNVSFHEGTGEKLPFSDNSIDFVIATGIMHHVDDPEMCIREMFRVCRKAILISDHNNFAFGSILTRRIRLTLFALSLLKIFTFVKQGFKKKGYSEEDGYWYAYSLINDFGLIHSLAKQVFILMCKEDSHYKASPSIVTKGNDGRVF